MIKAKALEDSLQEDLTTSSWLKQQLQETQTRDVLDVLNDIEVLHEVVKARAAEVGLITVEPPAQAQSSVEQPTIIMAKADTRHFDYFALGHTESEANEALLARYAKHCQNYPDAHKDLMQTLIDLGDVDYYAIQPGKGIRNDD